MSTHTIMKEDNTITVETTVGVTPAEAWDCWTTPAHICRWNQASTEWYCPSAQNDLRVGGKLTSRMEARDGSAGFDFSGTFTVVEPEKKLAFTLDDGREVSVTFRGEGDSTVITESFEAETMNSPEMQKAGWQAILDNFRDYAESRRRFVKVDFSTEINAPAELVFNTLTSMEGYSAWTSVFNPTSRYEGSWEKGARIKFLGEDEKGNTDGMNSEIRELIPACFISILHRGMINSGQKTEGSTETNEWSGAVEEYFLQEKDGKTRFSVSHDTTKEFISYFEETWPKALQKLRELCESGQGD